MSELVEIGAQAIWRARDNRFPKFVRRPKPDEFDPVSGALALVREEVAAVYAGLQKAGYRIVPVEPTNGMVRAAIDAVESDHDDFAAAVRAAIVAAPKEVSHD